MSELDTSPKKEIMIYTDPWAAQSTTMPTNPASFPQYLVPNPSAIQAMTENQLVEAVQTAHLKISFARTDHQGWIARSEHLRFCVVHHCNNLRALRQAQERGEHDGTSDLGRKMLLEELKIKSYRDSIEVARGGVARSERRVQDAEAEFARLAVLCERYQADQAMEEKLMENGNGKVQGDDSQVVP